MVVIQYNLYTETDDTIVGQFVACTDVSGKEISIITHSSADKPVLYSHKVTTIVIWITTRVSLTAGRCRIYLCFLSQLITLSGCWHKTVNSSLVGSQEQKCCSYF